MPETATTGFKERTSAIRARCASAAPRIRYRDIANELKGREDSYSWSYINVVLSDQPNTKGVDLDPVLTAIESALDRLEEKE